MNLFMKKYQIIVIIKIINLLKLIIIIAFKFKNIYNYTGTFNLL